MTANIEPGRPVVTLNPKKDHSQYKKVNTNNCFHRNACQSTLIHHEQIKMLLPEKRIYFFANINY